MYEIYRLIPCGDYMFNDAFQILQHYESHGVRLQQYWPCLWGSAAASRYAVKGEKDTALWRQPSTSEVLNLLDKVVVDDTVKNYPVSRTLKVRKLIIFIKTMPLLRTCKNFSISFKLKCFTFCNFFFLLINFT